VLYTKNYAHLLDPDSRYRDSLLAGRSGNRILVGGGIIGTHLDRSWGPPSLVYNGYLVFFRVLRGRDVALTTHPI